MKYSKKLNLCPNKPEDLMTINAYDLMSAKFFNILQKYTEADPRNFYTVAENLQVSKNDILQFRYNMQDVSKQKLEKIETSLENLCILANHEKNSLSEIILSTYFLLSTGNIKINEKNNSIYGTFKSADSYLKCELNVTPTMFSFFKASKHDGMLFNNESKLWYDFVTKVISVEKHFTNINSNCSLNRMPKSDLIDALQKPYSEDVEITDFHFAPSGNLIKKELRQYRNTFNRKKGKDSCMVLDSNKYTCLTKTFEKYGIKLVNVPIGRLMDNSIRYSSDYSFGILKEENSDLVPIGNFKSISEEFVRLIAEDKITETEMIEIANSCYIKQKEKLNEFKELSN